MIRKLLVVCLAVGAAVFTLAPRPASADTVGGSSSSGCVTRHVAVTSSLVGFSEFRIKYRLEVEAGTTVQARWEGSNGTTSQMFWVHGPYNNWVGSFTGAPGTQIYIAPGSTGTASYVLQTAGYGTCFRVTNVVLERVPVGASATPPPGGGGIVPPSPTPAPSAPPDPGCDPVLDEPCDPPEGWCWGYGPPAPGETWPMYPCEGPDPTPTPGPEACDYWTTYDVLFTEGSGWSGEVAVYTLCDGSTAAWTGGPGNGQGQLGWTAPLDPYATGLHRFYGWLAPLSGNRLFAVLTDSSSASGCNGGWPQPGAGQDMTLDFGATSGQVRGYFCSDTSTAARWEAVHGADPGGREPTGAEVWYHPVGAPPNDLRSYVVGVASGGPPAPPSPSPTPTPTLPPGWGTPPPLPPIDVDVDLCEDPSDADLALCQPVTPEPTWGPPAGGSGGTDDGVPGGTEGGLGGGAAGCEPTYPKAGQVEYDDVPDTDDLAARTTGKDPIGGLGEAVGWLGDMVWTMPNRIGNGIKWLWNTGVDAVVPSDCLEGMFSAWIDRMDDHVPFVWIAEAIGALESAFGTPSAGDELPGSLEMYGKSIAVGGIVGTTTDFFVPYRPWLVTLLHVGFAWYVLSEVLAFVGRRHSDRQLTLGV